MTLQKLTVTLVFGVQLMQAGNVSDSMILGLFPPGVKDA